MIEFVLGNVILFFLSIVVVYALFKSTGDTIDKYDIYSLSAQFYNVFVGTI